MRDDFPTLERPIKANSGNLAGGQFLKSVLLVTNFALIWAIGRMLMKGKGRENSCQLSVVSCQWSVVSCQWSVVS